MNRRSNKKNTKKHTKNTKKNTKNTKNTKKNTKHKYINSSTYRSWLGGAAAEAEAKAVKVHNNPPAALGKKICNGNECKTNISKNEMHFFGKRLFCAKCIQKKIKCPKCGKDEINKKDMTTWKPTDSPTYNIVCKKCGPLEKKIGRAHV